MSPPQIAPEHPKPEVLVRRLELDAADELGTVVQELVEEVNDRGQTPFSMYARFRESSITVAVIGAPAAAN